MASKAEVDLEKTAFRSRMVGGITGADAGASMKLTGIGDTAHKDKRRSDNSADKAKDK